MSLFYPNSFEMQAPNNIDGFKKPLRAGCAPMAAPDNSGKESPTARRMVRLREKLGFEGAGGGTRFAAFLGVSPQRWNNVEVGLPLSNQLAFLLVQRIPGLTLDWLYFGKPDGLPLELARRLGELEGLKTANTGR